MGKKQHSKDRMYLTAKEYKEHWGGFKVKKSTHYKPLPFYCCCLSLQPFKTPYITKDCFIFDITEILPWLSENGTHPVTGKKLTSDELIKLKFHKNQKGQYHCPVRNSIFNEHSHIVAIRQTGNVYSYQAIKELNFKLNSLRDLLEDEPFTKKDILTIQDPDKAHERSVSRFINLKKKDDGSKKAKFNATTQSVVDAVNKLAEKEGETSGFRAPKRKREEDDGKPKKKKYYSTHISTGSLGASITSSIAPERRKHVMKELTDEEVRLIRWKQVKGTGKKAYVRFQTSMGNLNFQIHCDYVPQTAHSFLTHCDEGYYENTTFHRKITSFMIQGGDPLGTGFGGKSAWGGKLRDEFHKLLRHDMRGILSMANSGPDTGGSQFFVTFSPQENLDDNHTVFGELVGGNDVLNQMEMVKTGDEDRPLEDITIQRTLVYKNPFNDPLPQELDEIIKKQEEEDAKKEADRGEWWTDPGTAAAATMDTSVGKYFKKKHGNKNMKKKQRKKKRSKLGLPEVKNKDKDPEKKKITRFSDFSNFDKKNTKKD